MVTPAMVMVLKLSPWMPKSLASVIDVFVI
jgi:hypothetical protein